MHARSTLFTLGIALAAGGCTLGGVEGPVGGDDDDELPGAALCSTDLSLSGTLAPPGAPAPAEDGCVPQGTWTVNVAVGDGDCGDVSMATSFTYTVTGEGRDREIEYTLPTGEEATLAIHAGGNGECEGSFEHIWESADGFHVVLLKPYFEPGTLSILGSGTYQLWSEHP